MLTVPVPLDLRNVPALLNCPPAPGTAVSTDRSPWASMVRPARLLIVAEPISWRTPSVQRVLESRFRVRPLRVIVPPRDVSLVTVVAPLPLSVPPDHAKGPPLTVKSSGPVIVPSKIVRLLLKAKGPL